MTRRIFTMLLVLMLTVSIIAGSSAQEVSAYIYDSEGDYFYNEDPQLSTSGESSENGTPVYFENKLLVGWRRADGSILFNPQDTVARNGNMLYWLLSNDEAKTIVLPPETIKIERTLYIGDNTTIIANGANIIQMSGNRPVIDHIIDRDNYSSLSNVNITGGNWYINNIENASNSQMSTIRFSHAQNISINNITIKTGYLTHALSLIACRNVSINGCSFTAAGPCFKNRIEESLQLDLATRKTAPNCAKAGEAFVRGQTCQNISVTNCTILGGRGLCLNKTDTEGGKWLNKYHVGITVTGCNITGMTGEALALHNTAKFTVRNNTIVSKSSRTDNKGYTYTIGVNIRRFSKNSIISRYTSSVCDNTIKGGYRGLYIGMDKYKTKGKDKLKYGKVTITNNKVYYKKGKKYKTYNNKSRADGIEINNCKNSMKNNKLYKW